MTPNGNIYIDPHSMFANIDMASDSTTGVPDLITQSLCIHEMTHVYQKQAGDNVVAQGLYRKYDYNYSKLGSIDWRDYGIEQQAQIVQDYFLKSNGLNQDPFNPRGSYPGLDVYENVLAPYFQNIAN